MLSADSAPDRGSAPPRGANQRRIGVLHRRKPQTGGGSGFYTAARGKPAPVWCSPPPQTPNRRRLGVLHRRKGQTGGGSGFCTAANPKPAADRGSPPPQRANRRRLGVLHRRKGQTGAGSVFSAAARGKPAAVWCSPPPQGANRRRLGVLRRRKGQTGGGWGFYTAANPKPAPLRRSSRLGSGAYPRPTNSLRATCALGVPCDSVSLVIITGVNRMGELSTRVRRRPFAYPPARPGVLHLSRRRRPAQEGLRPQLRPPRDRVRGGHRGPPDAPERGQHRASKLGHLRRPDRRDPAPHHPRCGGAARQGRAEGA